MDTSTKTTGPTEGGSEYTPYEMLAAKNALITTISTFLSHYFTAQFLQGRWLLWDIHAVGDGTDPEQTGRKVLEVKARFLYSMRETAQSLLSYPDKFVCVSAFEEDKINDQLEIISTPEREWMDILLNRCTEVMAADMSGVELTEGSTGQFLRKVIRLVRQDMHEPEHIKFMYLFCVYKMPEILFDQTIGNVIRRREIKALLTDPRVPRDLIGDFQMVRGGGGLFPKDDSEEEEEPQQPVDEGWDLEREHLAAAEKQSKGGAWQRLLARFRRK